MRNVGNHENGVCFVGCEGNKPAGSASADDGVFVSPLVDDVSAYEG